jgi:hypothetical protein
MYKPKATNFCVVARNICGSSVWDLCYLTHVAPKILRWLLGFWKSLWTPVYNDIFTTNVAWVLGRFCSSLSLSLSLSLSHTHTHTHTHECGSGLNFEFTEKLFQSCLVLNPLHNLGLLLELFLSIRDHKFCLLSNTQVRIITNSVVICCKVMSSNVTDLNCLNF